MTTVVEKPVINGISRPMQNCHTCGHEARAAAVFCSNCGLPLTPKAGTSRNTKRLALQSTESGTVLPRIMGQESSRIGAAIWILASMLWIYFSGAPGAWTILLGPSLAGALWPLIRHAGMTSRIDLWENTFQSYHQRAVANTGKLAKYVSKPFFVGCLATWHKSQSLTDVHLRAGIRIAALLYFVAAMGMLLLVVGYVLVVVAIAIAMLLFMLWLLGEALSRSTGSDETPATSRSATTRVPMFSTIKCPDCDGEMTFDRDCGNGKCSRCHGTGGELDFLEGFAEALSGLPQKCKVCLGSGKCQTCYGKGLLRA